MNWIKVKDQKPNNYQQCWVMHIKRYNHQYHAMYYEPDDTFRLMLKDTHDYPLNITHWYPLPELLSQNEEEQRELEAEMGCKAVHWNNCWYAFENGEFRESVRAHKDSRKEEHLQLAKEEYAKWKEAHEVQ